MNYTEESAVNVSGKEGSTIGKRGTLKVYLGMSAGVGKTYAMLSDAVVELQQGKNILAGYIEPHSRPATAALVEKLPTLEPKIIEYKGLTLREFDLDAALIKKPDIILVDELAHTNAIGSRHTKRWQDIEELLNFGINVRTTVNIQHIESLKDLVAQITGVEVQETVPDSFLTKVDDFELVDIPPDELLKRLETGKIYQTDKIGTALTNFFRKEHLIALREIALRHTANAVDVQLRNLRAIDKDKSSWSTTPRVLVCIAPSKFAVRLVRATARLSNHLKASFIVVTIETTRILGANESDQRYAQKAISLAERLGGEIIRSAGTDIVGEIINIARQRSVSIIVVGKPNRNRLTTFLFGSIADDLIRRSGDIDIHVVYGEKSEGSSISILGKSSEVTFSSVFLTFVSLFVTTLITYLLSPLIDPTNLAMLFLLPVIWTAFKLGRKEAIFAAVTSVLVFDYFFIPPAFSFSVSDLQYLVTFAVMLIVSILISTLTLRQRALTEASAERERRTSCLLGLSRRLSECKTKEDIAITSRVLISDLLGVEVVMFWPEKDGSLVPINRSAIFIEEDPQEKAVAAWVSSRKSNAGKSTDTLPAVKGFYIALESSEDRAPVLAVYRNTGEFTPSEVDLLESFAHLIAGAVNRRESQREATTAQLKAQREELRNILLSSVSHDLRTPLTTISGIASVIEAEPNLSEKVRHLAATLSESSGHLTRIVRNVLDLTRLESGEIALKRDWQNLEEIIGTAFRQTENLLNSRSIKIDIPKNFPLVFLDGLLFEQVFINFFENIARHTPSNTLVKIQAIELDETIKITISDNGPGISVKKDIFEKLVKGSNSPGLGLGLALIKAIVEAHGGSISASNNVPHGAEFLISLPLGPLPPEVSDE